ncbi:MAG TPA: flagellar export chaperone FliS [Bacillota bacterium]|nr:flagellar export chaperone FliS [Bacillota bacterium]
MAINKQYEAYQNNAVNTASSGELTLMLYNGCITFIKRAIQFTEKNEYAQKNEQVQKAQNIITELMITLDSEVDLSKQLLALYDYAQFQLREGNIKNDVSLLQEGLTIMKELRDTWKQMLLQTRKSGFENEARV